MSDTVPSSSTHPLRPQRGDLRHRGVEDTARFGRGHDAWSSLHGGCPSSPAAFGGGGGHGPEVQEGDVDPLARETFDDPYEECGAAGDVLVDERNWDVPARVSDAETVTVPTHLRF